MSSAATTAIHVKALRASWTFGIWICDFKPYIEGASLL
jgi:hypothetical protein